MNNTIIEAHKYCRDNKKLIATSEECGCFYCQKIFPASDVKRFVDKSGETALCPLCSIDSVIPDQAGYPLTPQFLNEMFCYWFGYDWA